MGGRKRESERGREGGKEQKRDGCIYLTNILRVKFTLWEFPALV